MDNSGTILARKFIDFPYEKDRINHLVNKIKGCQRCHGSKQGGKREWRKYNNLARDFAIKVAKAVTEFAYENNVDVIVFEKLDIKGKKCGRKKQRLHLWRKNDIQDRITHMAHQLGMRISRVCAWNTSQLAFDGSGKVERNLEMPNGKTNYSLCVFESKKQYNCDLNASYNIGARFFLRELCFKYPEIKEALPSVPKRTYSDLLKIRQEFPVLQKAA